jgi:two-component system, cell cycle sensor histidine kinase and response regulator CckA
VIFVIPLPKGAPKTILLVEDNDGIRMLVQHILEEGGFEVLVASDAAAALQIEGNFPRVIDLLLSDVMMPGISGPELAKKLKALRPEMRVMLMSGYSEGMLILNYGWYFIQKPFVPTALIGRVNHLLQSEVCDQGTDHFDTRL